MKNLTLLSLVLVLVPTIIIAAAKAADKPNEQKIAKAYQYYKSCDVGRFHSPAQLLGDDGRQVAIHYVDRTEIRDIRTEQLLEKIEYGFTANHSVLHPDGNLLLVAPKDVYKPHVWNRKQQKLHIFEPSAECKDMVVVPNFTFNGTHIDLRCRSRDRENQFRILFDLQTRAQIRSPVVIPKIMHESVVVESGKPVFNESLVLESAQNIFNVMGKEVQKNSDQKLYDSAVFYNKDMTKVLATYVTAVHLYDVKNNQLKSKYHHKEKVAYASFGGNDDTRVISVDERGRVRVFDTNTGKKLFKSEADIVSSRTMIGSSVNMSGDGEILIGSDAHLGYLRVWSNKEMPAVRRDAESPRVIQFDLLTPRGLPEVGKYFSITSL